MNKNLKNFHVKITYKMGSRLNWDDDSVLPWTAQRWLKKYPYDWREVKLTSLVLIKGCNILELLKKVTTHHQAKDNKEETNRKIFKWEVYVLNDKSFVNSCGEHV